MHPYHELIAVVQESASDLVEHQMTRDRERFRFERHKLALLVILILSLWIMFFLIWGELDEVKVEKSSPVEDIQVPSHHFLPPVPEPEPHYVI
jgi:hypothetical protein